MTDKKDRSQDYKILDIIRPELVRELTGASRQQVYNWKNRDGGIPMEYYKAMRQVMASFLATGGVE